MNPEANCTNDKTRWDLINAITNIFLVVFAFIGLIFVIREFPEIRKQNQLTERALKQTYRPIGIAIKDTTGGIHRPRFITDEDEKISDKDVKITFEIERCLMNRGNGVLLYIGCITLFSEDHINFIKTSRLEIIKDREINFDTASSVIRMFPLFPGESTPFFPLRWKNIKRTKFYYFYSIFFYKDRDGNLFDTLILDYIRYNKSFDFKSGYKQMSTNYFLHSYTKEEQNSLYNILKEKKVKVEGFDYHPMVDIIGTR